MPVHNSEPLSENELRDSKRRRFTYRGERLREVLCPVGGIGVGSIGFTGTGGFENFSLYHEPDTTALPDSHGPTWGMFAALKISGRKPVCRVIEGPMLSNRVYNRGLYAQGARKGGHEGLPRFREAVFVNSFPFLHVNLNDDKVPLKVRVTAFNPFIPGDSHNSSLPVMFLEYRFTNRSESTVAFDFMFSSSDFAARYKRVKNTVSEILDDSGVLFKAAAAPEAELDTSFAFNVPVRDAKVKASWFRGGWFDSISVLWREFEAGKFTTNSGRGQMEKTHTPGGSVLCSLRLKPGRSVTVPVIVAWYFPCGYLKQMCSSGSCDASSASDVPETPAWKVYYSAHWKDAAGVLRYAEKNYAELKSRTESFHKSLFSTTAPAYIIDAVASNLAILKSPTIIRLDHGGIWGWEGCFSDRGCCAGSCTHVWNYAQSLCHLFPDLERSLREQELVHSMDDETGRIGFRSAIPYGPTSALGNPPAADGQLGGILKVYRDWTITGEDAWLKEVFPQLKKSMDFCIRQWDPKRAGIPVEPHHNTYDIEFWGPEPLAGWFYVAALSAFSEICEHSGRKKEAGGYRALAASGAAYLDKHLFNGKYYFQQIITDGLDKTFRNQLEAAKKENPEAYGLLKSEGPKYQYGKGCLSDALLGVMMADFFGVEIPADRKRIRRNLASIFKYNFRPSMAEHANPQRPGYAVGNESGMLLCSWPKGEKPSLPFVYSDEVWTGIEYQVAAHLIREGFVAEGLTITLAARNRYDGRVRNPFNEYECGSYYARAMASYALLQACSGFHYDMRTKVMRLAPRLEADPFVTFFSTAGGFGTASVSEDKQSGRVRLGIKLAEGRLEIRRLEVRMNLRVFSADVKTVVEAGRKKKFLLLSVKTVGGKNMGTTVKRKDEGNA